MEQVGRENTDLFLNLRTAIDSSQNTCGIYLGGIHTQTHTHSHKTKNRRYIQFLIYKISLKNGPWSSI